MSRGLQPLEWTAGRCAASAHKAPWGWTRCLQAATDGPYCKQNSAAAAGADQPAPAAASTDGGGHMRGAAWK